MIALYVRVSQNEPQDEPQDVPATRSAACKSASIRGQELLLRDHVAHMRDVGTLAEWEADSMEVFADDGFSGMNMRRPELARLLQSCGAGEVDCVMVNDLSRLSRSYIDVGDLVERAFSSQGVRFVSRLEGIDVSGARADAPALEGAGGGGGIAERAVRAVESDLLRSIVSICNNAYSLQISANVKASMAASWRRGEHVQANVPFGYVYDRAARGRLRVDPVAGEWVRLMFALAADGLTTGQVAAELRRRDIPTPAAYARMRGCARSACYASADGQWNARKVRYILRREVYAGALIGGATRSVGVGRGSPKRVTATWEQVRIENAHEPLVSRELFEAAQQAIRSRAKPGL